MVHAPRAPHREGSVRWAVGTGLSYFEPLAVLPGRQWYSVCMAVSG
jgi:hypothetical protein